MGIGGLWKPEYVLKPRNIAARLRYRDTSRLPRRMAIEVHGRRFLIDPDEVIGRHLLHFGLFDLLVTEALTRLAQPDELAADIGANIGYMSCVLADRVGPHGKVLAFEPHPEIFADLVENTRGLPVDPAQAAVSDAAGTAVLHLPRNFAGNRGIASLETSGDSLDEVEVPSVTLDRALPPGCRIGVMKIDIEGHELAALRGAAALLRGGRIRDIVFEEHSPENSPVAAHLRAFGYHVFRLQKTFFGPKLLQPDAAIGESSWESPSLLATLQPERAAALFQRRGWDALKTSR